MIRQKLEDGKWYLVKTGNRPYGLKYKFAQYHHGKFHFEIGSYEPNTKSDCEWIKINPEQLFSEASK